MSALFQRVDSAVADELMADMGIGQGMLGVLTAAFLLSFVACLLPSGIAIDRFGPRAVQSVMLGVTALGALIFCLATGPFSLVIGRMLLGVGTASALLAGMKAAAAWCPREYLGLLIGGVIAAAGLGALVAADPAAFFVRSYGWGTLFILLAALAVICAVLTAILVPKSATAAGDGPVEDHGLSFVLSDPTFQRFAPLAAVVVGTVWAIQSQWTGGWLAPANARKLADIVTHMSLIAVGQIAGALIWGALADWAVRKGLSVASVLVGAVALCICLQIAAVCGIVLPTSVVWGALAAGAAAMLPFMVLLTHFPFGYAARACASLVVLQYAATLFIQWAVGIVVAIWPLAASGQTPALAYAMAFMVPIALQLAALAWFLSPRAETQDGAESVAELAVAFASLRSAAETAVNDLQQRRGAAHQVQGRSEPTSVHGSQPADTAAPAGAPAPAETMEAPTETPSVSARHASEQADSARATAETAAAPTGAAVAPTDSRAAPAETTVAPTDAFLRSILDAPLSAGLGSVPDTSLRASADAPNRAALAPSAEVAPSQEQALSFPLIAPSHVQALNAVYRRRPPLSAMIGERQIGIVAAWSPPDRRSDASHRLALSIDGEPGELWLPQSLLDMLIGSVDPALSLDRLGPARAAIILEFALDNVLTAIEMNLGCKLAVESFSSKVERLENDGQLPLSFTVVIDGLATTGCELRIPPDYAFGLAEGLDRHAGIGRSALDLPIPACLRVAAANLAASEIERLSPDDVVLVDATCQPASAVIAVIGERLVAPVALTPEGLRLAAQPIPGATSPWPWSMPTDATAAAWEADAETENRPLHVLFEIGRFELSASKVTDLAPNELLPLRPPQDQTVDIVVSGQRIGRGTLMQIGNRTGVRITAVRERSRPAPGVKRAPAEDR